MPDSCPALRALIEAQLRIWPEHTDFLSNSIEGRTSDELRVSEQAAKLITALATADASLEEMCSAYRFLCEEIVLKEELFFRRHKRYRLSTFAEAYAQYYSNRPLMRRYMQGLLLSDVFWLNHARALAYYVNTFLPGNKSRYDLLEIGPGHGLLIAFAAGDVQSGSLAGWDVSPESIEMTRHALAVFKIAKRVELVRQNLFEATAAKHTFDAIVISEVLEHLEDPVSALKNLRTLLDRGGRIWVNVPCNSPAPDHLYLLREPEEAVDLVRDAGFDIVDHRFYPMTGYSIDRARRNKVAVTCTIIGST